MTNKLSPQLQYGITGLFLLILSLFSSEALDIAIHDTYIVIDHSHILLLIACVFFFFAIISWIFQKLNRPFNRTLFLIHFWITVIGLALQFLLDYLLFTSLSTRSSEDYIVTDNNEYFTLVEKYNTWIILLMIVILVAQLSFVINVLLSIIRNKK